MGRGSCPGLLEKQRQEGCDDAYGSDRNTGDSETRPTSVEQRTIPCFVGASLVCVGSRRVRRGGGGELGETRERVARADLVFGERVHQLGGRRRNGDARYGSRRMRRWKILEIRRLLFDARRAHGSS